MKNLFDAAYDVAKLDHLDLGKHLNKLFEESGELAQAINKILGTKKLKKGETYKTIKENIAEEIMDMIQCLAIIAKINNIDYEVLKEKFKEKNLEYLKSLDLK